MHFQKLQIKQNIKRNTNRSPRTNLIILLSKAGFKCFRQWVEFSKWTVVISVVVVGDTLEVSNGAAKRCVLLCQFTDLSSNLQNIDKVLENGCRNFIFRAVLLRLHSFHQMHCMQFKKAHNCFYIACYIKANKCRYESWDIARNDYQIKEVKSLKQI